MEPQIKNNNIPLRNPRTTQSKTDPPDKDKPKPYDRPPHVHRPQSGTAGTVKIVIPPRPPSGSPDDDMSAPSTPTRSRSKRPREETTPKAHKIKRVATAQQTQTEAENQEGSLPTGTDQDADMLEEEETRSVSFSQAYASQDEEPDPDYLATNLLSHLLDAQHSIDMLQQEGRLNATIRQEDIAAAIVRLSESIPIIPINLQLEPLLNGIGNLCQKVSSLTTTLDNHNSHNHENPGLASSIHAPHSTQQVEKPNAHPEGPNQASQMSYQAAAKSNKKTPTAQGIPNSPSNPKLAHHGTTTPGS